MTSTGDRGDEIEWRDWGDEAFQTARGEDKLLLVDSGATWCHWCHVMDRTTYEDDDVVRLVNERFVPVRIDRDRLPDVDSRLQRAPALFSPAGASGGWPLTVLMTPDGRMLFKATYLPPRGDAARGASMGLVGLLQEIDRRWRDNRDELTSALDELSGQVRKHEESLTPQGGALRAELIAAVADGLKADYDERHGGFGGAPKFFTAAGLRLLATRAWAGDRRALKMLTHTLTRMARGGVYDQVAGGWHRYSVDERWHVPHFEKMAYDNAALLALYADAAGLTRSEQFERVARETRDWVGRVLTAPDRRGFYASRDADVGLDDDGDWFTWTPDQIRRAAGDDAELAIAAYGVDESGDVHGRPGRNVLHVAKTPEQLAHLLNMPTAEANAGLDRVRAKLLAARKQRRAPEVDRTCFADLNGMMIDAHLTFAERLGDDDASRLALDVLDALLEDLWDEHAGCFAHFREDGELQRPGLFADQAWMLRALIHACTTTGDGRYLDAARRPADFILARLTAHDGGFRESPDADRSGSVHAWQDAPIRSASSVAAQALDDLAHLSGETAYADAARRALEGFASDVRSEWGTFLGGYALAVDRRLNGPRSVVVVGSADDEAFEELLAAGGRRYLPAGWTIGLDSARDGSRKLLDALGCEAREAAIAYVCHGRTCIEPAHTPHELDERIDQLRAPAD